MTETATAAAPTAARYSESLHVLVDVPMRSVILALAIETAEERGGRPKEGESIRALLEDAITRLARRDRQRYDELLSRGRAELARRSEESAARSAARCGPQT